MQRMIEYLQDENFSVVSTKAYSTNYSKIYSEGEVQVDINPTENLMRIDVAKECFVSCCGGPVEWGDIDVDKLKNIIYEFRNNKN